MSEHSGSDEEIYSYTSSKTVYKRGRSRPSSADLTSHKVYVSSDTDERGASEYQPVSRWAVDYNNRNYVRSLCNKNMGLHRKLKGRPQKYKIQYDNNYFTRSKVNAPKGLHRKIPEIKRKYVPDDDVLADATGWEFDHGPEFDQLEQDVHFIPEGRIVRRGCYRWYGVKRNDSDCDIKLDEERENLLNEELEEELKYGHEFLQSDIPYLEEQKNRRYSRGGYRFYETLRNVNDFKPEASSIQAEATRDPEWRRKHHCNGVRYLDLELCDCEREDAPEHHNHVRKGKPFRRTILNKVYELRKEDSSKDVKRHATRLSLVPGDSRQSLYEGIPDRIRYGIKKSPSVRSVFKKKTEKIRSKREGKEYEEYEKEDMEQSYTELRPPHEERRVNRMTEVKHGKRFSDEDLARKERGGGRFDEHTYLVEDNDRSRRRHVRKGSAEDVRENYETWKENTLYKKDEVESGYHAVEKKTKERRKGKILNERDYPPKDIAVDRRRNNIEKRYDREEHRSQRPTSGSRDRHHGNEIRRLPEKGKVMTKKKDRHYVDANLQHIRDRGKFTRTEDRFKAELPQDKVQVLKKMPPHVRGKGIRAGDNFDAEVIQNKDKVLKKMPPHVRGKGIKAGDNFKAEAIQDKDQVLKKMPPHVEERVRNIRKRMERKLDEASQKHTDRRNKVFNSSSSDESIDLMKHKGHPNDRGETHNSEYEKYITKNGSEIWVKKNEKYAELHHKNHR